jgi:hypothetical protein
LSIPVGLPQVVGQWHHVPVVNSSQDQVSMSGCMGLEGMESAKEFWEHHPLYHSWQFKGWACQIGNSARPDKRNT